MLYILILNHSVDAGQVSNPPAVDDSETTSTSVMLRWASPLDPNGVIILYTVNIMAVSSDPAAYAAMMGMGGGAGDRRRKRQTQGLNPACILPGGPVGVEASINTTDLSLPLDDLSEFEHFQEAVAYPFPIFQLPTQCTSLVYRHTLELVLENSLPHKPSVHHKMVCYGQSVSY